MRAAARGHVRGSGLLAQALAAATLWGCASFSPDAGMDVVGDIAASGLKADARKVDNEATAAAARSRVRGLLASPLSAGAAVQVVSASAWSSLIRASANTVSALALYSTERCVHSVASKPSWGGTSWAPAAPPSSACWPASTSGTSFRLYTDTRPRSRQPWWQRLGWCSGAVFDGAAFFRMSLARPAPVS